MYNFTKYTTLQLFHTRKFLSQYNQNTQLKEQSYKIQSSQTNNKRPPEPSVIRLILVHLKI